MQVLKSKLKPNTKASNLVKIFKFFVDFFIFPKPYATKDIKPKIIFKM